MHDSIRYVEGDATRPQGSGPKIIVHVCNDVGGWGKGFVLALSQRWPETERSYRAWYAARETNDFGLGAVSFAEVEPTVWVANLIGQAGVRRVKGVAPVRYPAIAEGLAKVAEFARARAASVHMPRIGCGLAGGEWSEVEQLIESTLAQSEVAVTVYDYSPAP